METIITNKSKKIVTDDIINALKRVFDPEIDFSIYDIGLIYEVHIEEENINIVMTLTSFSCPEAQTLPEMVENEIKAICPHIDVFVDVTFEPVWNVDNMADEVKLRLGLL